MKIKKQLVRNQNWLMSRLDYIWTKYFADIPQTNKVFIRFGRFARLRLGSIKFDKINKDTTITISSLFRLNSVPQEVVDHTIAHELIHYSHGFSSPHPRLHKYPHHGGIIKKEMTERGMGNLYKGYRDWIKSYRNNLTRYG